MAGLMREQGLAARPGRKGRKHTTRQGKGRWRAPDLVKRDFPATGINQKWYGDGTEIPTGEGKLYLDSVLDMASRRILGHALGEHHDAALAYGAPAMAAAVRGGRTAGVIFHSDQGSEYTAGTVPGRPAGGWASASRCGPDRRWTTRSSSPGTPRWNGSCDPCGSSRSGPRRGPRSPRGSRTTTTNAGTRRWECAARWITSGPWRERTPRERSGPAARARKRRRLRRRWPSCAR